MTPSSIEDWSSRHGTGIRIAIGTATPASARHIVAAELRRAGDGSEADWRDEYSGGLLAGSSNDCPCFGQRAAHTVYESLGGIFCGGIRA
jgi:hypothetical protein